MPSPSGTAMQLNRLTRFVSAEVVISEGKMLSFTLIVGVMNEKKIKSLIKKELFELVFNFKSWLNVLVWATMPYLPQISKPYYKFVVAVLFSVFAGGQYVYDSYLNDIKFEGSLFLYNIRVKFLVVFFVKLIISVILSCISILINLPHIISYVNFFDMFWFLPLFVFFATIMYITSVFSKCAEVTSAVISILIATAVFAFTLNIDYFLVRVIFTILITCFSIFMSVKISYSKAYRTQL